MFIDEAKLDFWLARQDFNKLNIFLVIYHDPQQISASELSISFIQASNSIPQFTVKRDYLCVCHLKMNDCFVTTVIHPLRVNMAQIF